MNAGLILAAGSVLFLVAALWRLSREGFKLGPAARTWLMIAAIFGAVSAWLWWTAAR
jgi:hypothetical protein